MMYIRAQKRATGGQTGRLSGQFNFMLQVYAGSDAAPEAELCRAERAQWCAS
jgi:hypothetical protein